MLLTSYTREFSRPDCRPEAQTIHCIAHLDQDVGCALPYLNAVLGGVVFIAEPPTVSFKVQGKLITVQARKIAVNALADAEEADRILAWLQRSCIAYKTISRSSRSIRLKPTRLPSRLPSPALCHRSRRFANSSLKRRKTSPPEL